MDLLILETRAMKIVDFAHRGTYSTFNAPPDKFQYGETNGALMYHVVEEHSTLQTNRETCVNQLYAKERRMSPASTVISCHLRKVGS